MIRNCVVENVRKWLISTRINVDALSSCFIYILIQIDKSLHLVLKLHMYNMT